MQIRLDHGRVPGALTQKSDASSVMCDMETECIRELARRCHANAPEIGFGVYDPAPHQFAPRHE